MQIKMFNMTNSIVNKCLTFNYWKMHEHHKPLASVLLIKIKIIDPDLSVLCTKPLNWKKYVPSFSFSSFFLPYFFVFLMHHKNNIIFKLPDIWCGLYRAPHWWSLMALSLFFWISIPKIKFICISFSYLCLCKQASLII